MHLDELVYVTFVARSMCDQEDSYSVGGATEISCGLSARIVSRGPSAFREESLSGSSGFPHAVL